MIITVIVVGGLATFLDNACKIIRYVGFSCDGNGAPSGLSDDLRAMLNDRANAISSLFSEAIRDIERRASHYQQTNCTPMLDSGVGGSFEAISRLMDTDSCGEVATRTLELTLTLRATSEELLTLHNQYLEHLENGNQTAAHEIHTRIHNILGNMRIESTTVIGVGNTDTTDLSNALRAYFLGFPRAIVNMRDYFPDNVLESYLRCIEPPLSPDCN